MLIDALINGFIHGPLLYTKYVFQDDDDEDGGLPGRSPRTMTLSSLDRSSLPTLLRDGECSHSSTRQWYSPPSSSTAPDTVRLKRAGSGRRNRSRSPLPLRSCRVPSVCAVKRGLVSPPVSFFQNQVTLKAEEGLDWAVMLHGTVKSWDTPTVTLTSPPPPPTTDSCPSVGKHKAMESSCCFATLFELNEHGGISSGTKWFRSPKSG